MDFQFVYMISNQIAYHIYEQERTKQKARTRCSRTVTSISSTTTSWGHIPGRIACQAAWAVKHGVGEDEVAAFVARKCRGFEKVSHDISDGVLTVSYTALDI